MPDDVTIVPPPDAPLPATRSPAQALIDTIRTDSFKQQVALALPGNVSPDRFVRATVTGLLSNPDIANAESNSLYQSIIRCAQDGLLPDGHEAALVVYKMKDGTRKAQYIPMIGGFRKIAAEHGWTLRTRVVFAADEFEYTEGQFAEINHKPARLGEDRGEMIGAYCIAYHEDGRREYRVMDAKAINKRRLVSRTRDRGPWVDWEEQMWEKTVGRDLFQDLPLGDRERVKSVMEASAAEPEEVLGVMYPAIAKPEPGIVDEMTIEAMGQVRAEGFQPLQAEPLPLDEPELPVEPNPLALSPEDELRLPVAAARKPPHGSYQTYSLERILAFGESGIEWLSYALRQPWPHDPSFATDLQVFCKARIPEVYEQWLKEA